MVGARRRVRDPSGRRGQQSAHEARDRSPNARRSRVEDDADIGQQLVRDLALDRLFFDARSKRQKRRQVSWQFCSMYVPEPAPIVAIRYIS